MLPRADVDGRGLGPLEVCSFISGCDRGNRLRTSVQPREFSARQWAQLNLNSEPGRRAARRLSMSMSVSVAGSVLA